MFGLTSAASMVPEIVAGGAGHGWIPAGPLPRFVQRNTEIPPLTPHYPSGCGLAAPLLRDRKFNSTQSSTRRC